MLHKAEEEEALKEDVRKALADLWAEDSSRAGVRYIQQTRRETFLRRAFREARCAVYGHGPTHESHYWSGGYVLCSNCHIRLETLWTPIRKP